MSRTTQIGALIVLAGVLTFWNSLSNPFVYDDASSVVDNATIRHWRTAFTPPPHDTPISGRPLVNASLALNYAVGGLDPRGYHAVNIAVHIACALLLFALVRRTLDRESTPTPAPGPARRTRATPSTDPIQPAARGSRLGARPHRDPLDQRLTANDYLAHRTFSTYLALAVALVWLVHPLDSEPPDYVTARTESLMALCLLATLYFSLRAHRERRALWSALSVATCAAGMASKETMAVAPLLVAGYDRTFLFSSWKEAWRTRRWLYAGLASTWILLAFLIAAGPRSSSVGLTADQGLVRPISTWTYLLNQTRMIVRYLRLAVWPSGLVLDYGPPRPLALGDVLWPAAIVLGVLAAVAVAWRYSRRLGFLAASAVLTLAPASSLIPVHTEVGAERRMYVPMMALTILAVVGVHTWSRQYLSGKASRLNALFAVGVCAALAVATVQRNSEFASPLSIWQTVVDRWPHGRARYNLSMALEAAGRGDEAMAMLRASVADYPEARSILGFHLLDQGQVEEGIDELRAFLRERPAQANAVLAHGRIAEALYAKREYAAALPEYRESLARRPDQIAWWTDYAISLAATGNSGEAVRAFERVTALRPGEANAHRNLANALLDHGDYARAEQEATEAARLAPGDPVVTEILSLARGGQQSGHAGHSPHGPAPVESSMAPGSQTIPTEAVVLEFARRQAMPRAGIGTAHDPVGTVSKEAQALYDRGLAYLQSYWWLEAARCFNQALSLDPALAVAQASLSIAYTELNAPGAAGESLARATDASGKSSDHDRRHIELRAMQMAAEKAGRWDATALGQYRAAIEAALAKFPSDEELWLLRGLAESPDPAERGQGSPASAVQYYRKALTLSPGHFAGHHYLTHAYENSGQVNEALAEGATYAKMAPGVPHARHMHGHNLRRVGRVEEAIGEFEAADAIETSYFKAERIPVELDWHYQHNIDLLATAYQYTGRMAKAEARLRASFAIPSVLVQQEFNKREWPVFLIGRGRGQEALDAATVMAGHRSPIVSAAGHVMMGQARLAMGQYQAAADEANTALRTMRAAPLGAGIVANALQELQGEFLLRTGQRDKGRTMLEDLVKKVRAGPGPDAWTQALFTIESIARTSRDADDWEFAAWAAKQMIDHDPNYAGSHFALGLVARHQGDRITARAQFELARRYWKNADADLVELQTVTKELAPPE